MPLFFRFHRPIEATADIVALTGVTGYLTYVWSQVDPTAAWCMAPYLGWLSFATYLSVCSPLQEFSRITRLTSGQAGCGYLNDWDFSDKESSAPKAEGSGTDEKYVNEK